MSKRPVLSILLALALAATSFHVDAKRLGGGKSFGRQSTHVTQRNAANPVGGTGTAAGMQQNAAARPGTANPATPTPAPRKPWAGILGGLAAGLGLAWLAHSLGLGAGFGNILLMVLLVAGGLMLWKMFRSRGTAPSARAPFGTPTPVPAGGGYDARTPGNDMAARSWESQGAVFTPAPAAPAAAATGGSMIGFALSGSQSCGVPEGFDVEGFLSAAKRNFLTLQHAWDRGDLTRLRTMMTDEMLADIKQQLADRDSESHGAPNTTEVPTLEAKLLGIEETPTDYLASVEFSGMVREDPAAAPHPFREVWNMSKPRQGGGWLVAGVQALQ